VVLVHDDDDVHEEEQVAYVSLDAAWEEPLLYEIYRWSLESIAISPIPYGLSVSTVVLVQDDADVHEEEQVA